MSGVSVCALDHYCCCCKLAAVQQLFCSIETAATPIRAAQYKHFAASWPLFYESVASRSSYSVQSHYVLVS
eukprot:20908-Heterococcus_DN1.PRE.2